MPKTCAGLPLAFALAILIASPAPAARADAPAASEVVRAFDRLVRTAGRVCQHEPARECVEVAFDYADADGSGGVTPAEGHRVQDAAAAWLAWQAGSASDDRTTPKEHELAAFGLWLADTLGIDNLHASYDRNGDGVVTRAELLEDADLDERPMSEVLRDPAALQTLGLAERLGFLLRLLQDRRP